MTAESRICAFEDCKKPFIARTHNQRYHTNECCNIATNRRIMQRYYEKKARRAGKHRECLTGGCTNILSRYNNTEYCSSCTEKRAGRDKKKLLSILGEAC